MAVLILPRLVVFAEQKARVTYDNLLRLIDDRDVCDVLKFLREREIVHYQRFGEAKRAARHTVYSGCRVGVLWVFLR